MERTDEDYYVKIYRDDAAYVECLPTRKGGGGEGGERKREREGGGGGEGRES